MPHPLIGTWRMLSLQIHLEDTGETAEPWGENPPAWLIVTPEFRLMTVGTAGGPRQPPKTDAEAAALLVGMVCYSGKTRLDGPDRFVTKVDTAWHPIWQGTEQAREFRIEDNILRVRTDPVPHPSYPGRLLRFLLSWEREA